MKFLPITKHKKWAKEIKIYSHRSADPTKHSNKRFQMLCQCVYQLKNKVFIIHMYYFVDNQGEINKDV